MVSDCDCGKGRGSPGAPGVPSTWNWMRPLADRSSGGSDESMSLITIEKLAWTPRESLSAVKVTVLPLIVARTPGLPSDCTSTTVGSGWATPASR